MFRNMPLGIFSETTGLREKLRLASSANFEGVDIDIDEATVLSERCSVPCLKGMIDSFNLKIGAWNLPFSVDAEERIFEEGLKKLEGYARTAKTIGAMRVLAVIPPADDRMRAFCGDRLIAVAKILGAHGCRLGLDFSGTPAEIKDTGIVLNARRWHLSGGSLRELKKIDVDSIVYVRLGDVNADSAGRFLPGETGVIDLPGFLRALADAGYDGPVAPELPDRNLLTLPEEMATRLLGGSLVRLWNGVFKEKSD